MSNVGVRGMGVIGLGVPQVRPEESAAALTISAAIARRRIRVAPPWDEAGAGLDPDEFVVPGDGRRGACSSLFMT
ncbi:MAG: hypothetical protein L6Q92_06740 [Phycisphaerae bacterium]|nr:hypothetical protein [Phycisphaerae bacterium]